MWCAGLWVRPPFGVGIRCACASWRTAAQRCVRDARPPRGVLPIADAATRRPGRCGPTRRTRAKALNLAFPLPASDAVGHVTDQLFSHKGLGEHRAFSANRVDRGHIALFPSRRRPALLANAITRPFASELLGAHQALTPPRLVEFSFVEFHRSNLRTPVKMRQ